jgi:hypothetical protein
MEQDFYQTKQEYADEMKVLPPPRKPTLPPLEPNSYKGKKTLSNAWAEWSVKEIESNTQHLNIRCDLTFKQFKKIKPSSNKIEECGIQKWNMANSKPTLSKIRYELNREKYGYQSWYQPITEDAAIKNISFFLDRLNTTIYKKAYQRHGKRIDIISSIEGGKGDLRDGITHKDSLKPLHAHLLLEEPKHLSFKEYSKLILKVWKQTEWGWWNQHSIAPINTHYQAVEYNVKSSFDSLDLENTYLATK